MSDEGFEYIPIKNLISEEGAHELATSPDMQPYLRFVKAIVQDADPTSELDAIRALPLEKRYVWRVASAMKWAFADCEDLNVEADKLTMTPEDLAKVTDLLKYRPMQLCLFLKALVGEEEMVKMMIRAIGVAKQSS